MGKPNFWNDMGKSAALMPDVPEGWPDMTPQRRPSADNQDTALMPWTVTDGGKAPTPVPKYSAATFADINRPGTKAPSDRELGYDPNGPGEWQAAFRHPIGAPLAKLIAWAAWKKTEEEFGTPNINTPRADAFRHAYASYLVTKRLGGDVAREFGNAHEIDGGNQFGEKYRDLYNNKVGRDLAVSGQGDPVRIIRDAIDRGWTRNGPFNQR